MLSNSDFRRQHINNHDYSRVQDKFKLCTSSGNTCFSQCLKTLHVELNYILYMIFGEIFLSCFSVQKNTLKSLSQSLTFLHQYDENIRCTAYCSIIPKPFVSSKKETRQRIVACIEAICGCYRQFYGFRVFILSKDLLILHKMINWRNPRLFSVLIFVIHSGFLQEFTVQMFKIYRPLGIKM